MFINQGAKPQKSQQSFWLHLYELSKEGWRSSENSWLPPHPFAEASMWAKGVKAFTFHKKTNISPTNASTRQLSNFGRWKSLHISFLLKLLHEGASMLLPQCWNCKNLTKHSSFFVASLQNSDILRSGWMPLPCDLMSKGTTYVLVRPRWHELNCFSRPKLRINSTFPCSVRPGLS